MTIKVLFFGIRASLDDNYGLLSDRLLGGMIAIEVAELCPESVKGVVSIEGWTNARHPKMPSRAT